MTTLANDTAWNSEKSRRTTRLGRRMKSSFPTEYRRAGVSSATVGSPVSETSSTPLAPSRLTEGGSGKTLECTVDDGIGHPAEPPKVISRRSSFGDDDPTLRIYLQEISETPLLTPEDEARLAGRIQRGDDEAREQMITANLRLVVKIAKDFMGMGLPLLDMINEGNMGLMRAVDRFDPSKGAKLSTYAAWWIKQSIRRGLANQGKTIRLPVHLVDLVARMRRASMKFHEEVGRDPSDSELAELLGLTRRRVSELWDASQRTTSLDAPLGDDEDNQLADVVPDEQAQTAFQEMERGSRHDMIRDLLGQLGERELWILNERFGLNGRNERTLEDLGREVRLTRERIRQIEHQALKKMRRLVERREAQLDPDLAEYHEGLRSA